MKRTVLFFEDVNESGTNHPWFVISDPDNDNNVLIVNCTKIYNTGREDLSCILRKGCHPNVTEDSYISYFHAKEISTFKIHRLENLKQISFKRVQISEEILLNIQEGAKKSQLLPEELEKYFDYF